MIYIYMIIYLLIYMIIYLLIYMMLSWKNRPTSSNIAHLPDFLGSNIQNPSIPKSKTKKSMKTISKNKLIIYLVKTARDPFLQLEA